MNKKFSFTQGRIEKLPTPKTGRIDYHDTGCPKLTCRVSSTGNKSFGVLKWNGKNTRRVSLGRFPDVSVHAARELARQALTEIASGIDPTEKKRKKKKQSMTLQEMFDEYIETKSLKPLSIKDYGKKIAVFTDWLNKPASNITREMVLSKHRELTKLGSTSRDNKLRVLRLVLNYGVAAGVLSNNPVDALKEVKLWKKPNRKKRIIKSEDLQAWYEAVIGLNNEQAKVYLLMLLYTGLRSNEALSLKWSNVDFTNHTLTVMDTKNGSNHTVYIATKLKPWLRSLQGRTGHETFLFPGNSASGHMDIPRKPIAKVIETSGVEFSSHDCRRTFATIAEAVGTTETIIKRLLNHTMDNDVTTGYINTEAETLARATDKIGNYIHSKVHSQSNVVTLKTN